MAIPNYGSTLEGGVGGLPIVALQGLNTNKACNFSGTTIDASGNLISISQTERTVNSALVGATVILTATNSGSTYINVSTSGSPSWTLPTAVNGLYFTFVCGNATTGFTVTSATAVIHAKTSATGTAITTTTTLTNTQATAVVGDAIQLICDGIAWWEIAQTGIFAAS